MAKYLDKSGVTYLWNKIKGLFTDQSLNTKNKTYAGAINEINTKIGNLTGAFLWKGKFDTLPAVTNYEAGNVVGVGKKEYVLTVTEGTKTWEEFGDEGSYLLKTTAEETYLKKTAGEVKTANLADNAVTSTKLAMGARKPIILTPDTTEVDEETYQKLLSDDVDVVFMTSTEDANLCTLTLKYDDGDAWNFTFTSFSHEGASLSETYLYGYNVRIIKTGNPHQCEVIDNSGAIQFDSILLNEGFINKSTLSPVLQEIDLGGTDAERKAKLDQFETDWKALTGASDLTGARFVGKFGITDDIERVVTGIMTYCAGDGPLEKNDNHFYGICNGYSFSRQKSQIAVKVSCTDGSLTITPLFSNLEAITIYTDNTPEHMQANLNNIAAYEANLQALGVDTTKSLMIPVCGADDGGYCGYMSKWGDDYVGYSNTDEGVTPAYFYINNEGLYKNYILTDWESVETTFTNKSLNAKSLEAITIKINNSTESKASNVAAIKAYVDNLTALGVDTTKGYMIPVKLDNGYHGFIMGTDAAGEHTGVIKRGIYSYGGGWIFIDKIGTYQYLEYLTLGSYDNLTTTAKTIVPAINEINANAVHSDKFVPTLEAIAIKTGNTSDINAANVAAINAYVDNLKVLGVDTTKGYEIPILYNSGSKGFIGYNPNAASSFNGYAVTPEGNLHTLTMNATTGALSNKILATTAITDALSTNKQPKTDAALKTTSKTITGAINEVNDKTAYMAFTDVTKLSTNLGKRLIYKGGNVTLSSPITINSNINEIDFNGATLTVGSLAKTGISVITGHSHCIIKNLIVSGTWSVNTDTVNNIIDTFSGVENVSVDVTINGTHYGRGFHNCQRLTSCKSEIKGVNITEGRAYNYCEYLYMCRVGANSKGTGFFHCTSMDSCDIFNGGCIGSELIECSKYTKVSYYVSGNRRYFSDVDNISTKTLQINGINIANIAELSNVIANSSESVNSVPIIDPNDKSIQKMGVVIGNADNGGTGYSDNPTVVVRNTSGNIFINDGHYNGIGCTTKYAAYLVEQNKTDISGKQDKLISGTNIKTINNQTLLGSGNITISGGGSGDVTAAGDNTFTGNNVFNGIAIADILDGTQYQITGDNGVLMFARGATNDDIEISGVATPTYSNSAANKSYVDTQISTALGTVLTQLQNI